MFGQILYTQWKWTRGVVVALTALAFLVPTLIWRFGAVSSFSDYSAMQLYTGLSAMGPMLAVTAAAAGFLVVAIVWGVDAAGRHVYPLALPLPWSQYITMRFGAGLLTLLIPAIGVWLGSLLVLAMIEIPPTLRTYPGTLALRFLLGSAVAYAMTFALQYLFGRRAVAMIGFIVIGGAAISLSASFLGFGQVIESASRLLLEWPGPFAVFAADWALVDV